MNIEKIERLVEERTFDVVKFEGSCDLGICNFVFSDLPEFEKMGYDNSSHLLQIAEYAQKLLSNYKILSELFIAPDDELFG